MTTLLMGPSPSCGLQVWVFQAAGYWGVTLFLPTFLTSIGLNVYRTFFLISGAQLVGGPLFSALHF